MSKLFLLVVASVSVFSTNSNAQNKGNKLQAVVDASNSSKFTRCEDCPSLTVSGFTGKLKLDFDGKAKPESGTAFVEERDILSWAEQSSDAAVKAALNSCKNKDTGRIDFSEQNFEVVNNKIVLKCACRTKCPDLKVGDRRPSGWTDSFILDKDGKLTNNPLVPNFKVTTKEDLTESLLKCDQMIKNYCMSGGYTASISMPYFDNAAVDPVWFNGDVISRITGPSTIFEAYRSRLHLAGSHNIHCGGKCYNCNSLTDQAASSTATKGGTTCPNCSVSAPSTR